MVRSLSSFILAVVGVFPASVEQARYLKLIDILNETGLTTKKGVEIRIIPPVKFLDGRVDQPKQDHSDYKVIVEASMLKKNCGYFRLYLKGRKGILNISHGTLVGRILISST